jgi:Probable cobalt transporter subunit (CbtA)
MAPRQLLVRGMLVGVLGAAVAFLFARLFGEGPIDAAIGVESAHAAAGADKSEVVSRAIQSTLGLGAAVLVYGAAIGGIFGLGFAFAYGRLGALGARATAAAVAAIGFSAGFLVPFLKYPANPPAIGSEDTIGRRTVLYVLMVGISVAAAIVGVLLARGLAPRLGWWDAILVAAGSFVALAALAMLVLPAIDEVPDDFPATVLWRFRVASVGTQLSLWATIGLAFGALTERRVRRDAPARQSVP